MDTKGGEHTLMAPVDQAGRGVARTAEKALWGAVGAAMKLRAWLDGKLHGAAGRPPVLTSPGSRRPGGTRQPAGARPQSPAPPGIPATARGLDRVRPLMGRAPIVHRIERNPRTDDATVASHIMLSLKGIKDPKLQEKALQDMDMKQLRLLNRHANNLGEAGARNAPDAVTRRACNAVHEVTRRRLGDMSRWSGNQADRIPSTAERNDRLIRDMSRTPSRESYVRDCTPKERTALKTALTLESKNPKGWDKKLITQSLKTIRAADQPRPAGYAPPGGSRSESRSRTPVVVRGAERAVGGTRKTENSRAAALAR